MEPGTIELAGENSFSENLSIVGETHCGAQRAGGSPISHFPGSFLIREELKKREKDSLNCWQTARKGSGRSSKRPPRWRTHLQHVDRRATQALVVGQQLMSGSGTQTVGRLVLTSAALPRAESAHPMTLVRDGDKLLIPKKTQEVTILGEVQSPTSHVFVEGLSRDDYINRSGGTTQKADRKRIYVVRANGDVLSGERSGWFRRSHSTDIQPGDTIVVPLDTERVRALPIWQSVSTIIYNLAIALLAIRSVN